MRYLSVTCGFEHSFRFVIGPEIIYQQARGLENDKKSDRILKNTPNNANTEGL